MGLLGPLDRPSPEPLEPGTAETTREGTKRRGPGQCPSRGRAAGARGGAESFKTQNATGGEIKKKFQRKEKGETSGWWKEEPKGT